MEKAHRAKDIQDAAHSMSLFLWKEKEAEDLKKAEEAAAKAVGSAAKAQELERQAASQ